MSIPTHHDSKETRFSQKSLLAVVVLCVFVGSFLLTLFLNNQTSSANLTPNSVPSIPLNNQTPATNFPAPNLVQPQLAKVEKATTEEELARGLMYRRELCARCGMWFEFPDQQLRTFWMKNTWIDLDIIFIDQNGQIINVEAASAQPQAISNYPVYSSLKPAKYVLEVPQNSAKLLSLQPGTILDLGFLESQLVPFEMVPSLE